MCGKMREIKDAANNSSGFTLIELLVVIIIIAVMSGIIAPVAYKSVGRFHNLLLQKEKIDISKRVDFLSFIADQPCKIKKNIIVCGKLKYAIR